LKLYTELKREYSNVGVVLQAYLRRTVNDIAQLSKKVDNLNFRLCKGIYIESHQIAWKDREIIRQNFRTLLKELFRRGIYVGIATHDEWLVWAALDLIHRLNVPHDRYEFQMLLGVLPELRKIINYAFIPLSVNNGMPIPLADCGKIRKSPDILSRQCSHPRRDRISLN
jgi:proline dehydrogenase